MVMEWEPDQIRVYRDGVLAGTLNDRAKIPQVAHRLCLQLDAFTKTLGSTRTSMWVDYVRIYKRA
jgi:hypothetical protein